jgi:uncharacterized protein with NRDE domain
MCLIVFAWRSHPDYRLVLAANRDEFHARPSQELHFWPDNPDVLAGRDLQAGGTWLAAHRGGRFATVTNYREQQKSGGKLKSRGALVTDFVTSDDSADTFSAAIDAQKYAGFSLLTADRDDLYYVSNRGDPPRRLEAGIYGLSNASLDTPWPKVERSRAALGQLLDSNSISETTLYRLMSDRTCASVSDVNSDHLPFQLARALTAPFIVTPDYGTRCSTVMLWSNDGNVVLSERRFNAAGNASGDSSFSFAAGSPQSAAP